MTKINGGDTIPYGVYAGRKLGNVVKEFGRKVLLEIVKFNDVDDDYLKKYHYHHPATEEEKLAWEEKKRQELSLIQVDECLSTPMEVSYETPTENVNYEYQDQDASAENPVWEESVLFDPEDDPEDARHLHLPITGYKTHQYRGLSVVNIEKSTI